MIEQLFVISGSSPVIFSIPVWANFEDPRSEMAKMFLAIPVLRPHMEAFKAHVAEHATFSEGMWTINRMTLARIGTQIDLATGPDIERLFTWERMKAHQANQPAREQRKDMDEFLDTLYQTGLPITREWLGILWNQICTHALDWLINKERPLDMYFVKLHNSPFRSDWKELLKKDVRGRRKFHASVLDLNLLVLSPSPEEHKRTRWIERWIEAEPTNLWRKNVTFVERQRCKAMRKQQYVNHVRASIWRFKETAIRLFRVWRRTPLRKHPADARCWQESGFRLVRPLPPPAVRPRPRPPVPPPVVVPAPEPKVEKAPEPKPVPEPKPALPKVPTFRPIAENLWNPWANLRRRYHATNENVRMSVLPPFEKRYPVQLLGKKRRPEPRVARPAKLIPRADFESANRGIVKP